MSKGIGSSRNFNTLTSVFRYTLEAILPLKKIRRIHETLNPASSDWGGRNDALSIVNIVYVKNGYSDLTMEGCKSCLLCRKLLIVKMDRYLG